MEKREKRMAVQGSGEDLKLRIMTMEMRLADLSARMARPKKGDHPDRLNREYLELAEELRGLKQQQ